MKVFLINILQILLFAYVSVKLIIDPSKFESFSLQDKRNTFCTDTQSNRTALIDNYVCSNPIKKRKFLWIMFDGLAFDEIPELESKTRENAILFKIHTTFFRQSGSLHELYLTGKFSRNFVATRTETDNLLDQMIKAKLPIQFRGTKYPVYTMGGGDLEESLNRWNSSHIEMDPFPFYVICPSKSREIFVAMDNYDTPEAENHLQFNRTALTQDIDSNFKSRLTYKSLDSCFQEANIKNLGGESQNLIYYSTEVDHYNHGYSKEHPRTFVATHSVQEGIQEIMNWVDQNPEYALILSSDHGGQAFYGEDNFCNHGCLNPGNEGILFIYVNEFRKGVIKPNRNSTVEFIESFDVASTVSQVIDNANIPLESQGRPKNLISNKEIFKYQTLRMHEIQLKTVLSVHPLSHKLTDDYRNLYSSEFYNRIKGFTSEEEFDMLSKSDPSFLTSYEEYNIKMAESLKKLNLESLSRFMYYIIIAVITGGFVYTMRFIINSFFGGLESTSFLLNKPYIGVILLMLYSDNIFAFIFASNFENLYILSHYFFFALAFALFIFSPKLNLLKDLCALRKKIFREDEMEDMLPVSTNDEADEKIDSSQGFKKAGEAVEIKNDTDTQDLRVDKSLDSSRSKTFDDLFPGYSEVNTYEKDLNSNIKGFVVFITFSIISIIIWLRFEIFAELKKINSHMDEPSQIDKFNYPFFIIFMFWLIWNNSSEFYLDKKFRIRLSWILYVYYFRVITLMIQFDSRHPKYFINQDDEQTDTAKWIYSLLLFHIIWCFISPCVNKNPNTSAPFEFTRCIKLPVISFLFFINDEFERIIILVILAFTFNILTYFYRKCSDLCLRFFIIVLIIKLSESYYSMVKGTFTFDISLKAGNKTIGHFQDETPLFTGFLFGAHKLQTLMMGSVFLLDLVSFKKAENEAEPLKYDSSTEAIAMILFSKLILAVLSFCSYFFNRQETEYLNLFMWCHSKLMLISFLYFGCLFGGIFLRINYLLYRIFKKLRHILKRSQKD